MPNNPFPSHTDKSDPARYLVPLRAFDRPRLFIIGGYEFEWPVGTENLTISGQATLGIHTYIGGIDAHVQVVHRDNSRIEMSGIFPGKTGATNMRSLRNILTLPDPPDHKRLELPGILPLAQEVVMESYSFQRSAEDLTDSFEYTVTFIKVGAGGTVSDPPAPEGPTGEEDRGDPARTFTIKENVRTLRAVAVKVYGKGKEEQWRKLYNLNKKPLNTKFPDVPLSKWPTKPLPIGLAVKY